MHICAATHPTGHKAIQRIPFANDNEWPMQPHGELRAVMRVVPERAARLRSHPVWGKYRYISFVRKLWIILLYPFLHTDKHTSVRTRWLLGKMKYEPLTKYWATYRSVILQWKGFGRWKIFLRLMCCHNFVPIREGFSGADRAMGHAPSSIHPGCPTLLNTMHMQRCSLVLEVVSEVDDQLEIM